jgi:predicted metal-binding transcription factor (methanogenesis marker protein 9)
MLTRKDFIKKANEFINTYKTYKNKNAWILSQVWIYQITDYCKIAKKSNERFDEIRFRDYIEKGLYE